MSHTLYYLPLRARGEAIRMILAYGNIPYNDEIVDFERWAVMKQDHAKIPLGQLPVLTLPSGRSIAQSGAIIRYVANLAGVYPQDPERAAVADMVLELAMEMNPINPILNWFAVDSEAYAAAYNAYFTALPARLLALQRILGESAFFGGDKVSHGDFLLFHILNNTILVSPGSLTCFGTLVGWMERMNAIPQLKEYLERRPGPPLVGKEGSLMRTFAN